MRMTLATTLPAVVVSLACGIAGAAAPATGGAPPGARDPQIVALIKPAIACKLEYGSFDSGCPGMKAWRAADALFDNGKGDVTLASMLQDPDLKVRILGATRSIRSDSALGDKALMKGLAAALARETARNVLLAQAGTLARADLEKLGLMAEARAAAKHPSADARGAFISDLYASHRSPFALALTKESLGDADPHVVEQAIDGLTLATVNEQPADGCALLATQVKRKDAAGVYASWKAAGSRCPGMGEIVADSLVAQAGDATLRRKQVITFAHALKSLCESDNANAGAKRKAFTAARLVVTDPDVDEQGSRRDTVGMLGSCDKAAARPLLRTLAKDKDAELARRASEALAELK